jgi:hypothetical protein
MRNLEFKGTKGDWLLKQEKSYHSVTTQLGRGMIKIWFSDNHIIKTSEEALANAKLIASAPELLEALIALMKEYKQGADSGDWGNWKAEEQDEYIQAQQVIEKSLL